MSSSAPEHPRKQLVIERIPFNSPISRRLISALDVEQELLHPDWQTYPYAGPGNWLVGDPATNVPGTDTAIADSSPPTGRSGAIPEIDRNEVYTFAAFVSPLSDSLPSTTHVSYKDEDAVGCIGVKILHGSDLLENATAVNGDLTKPAKPVTAQIKRLYVEPAYRGRQSNLGLDRSVAQMLLEFVESFARKELDVQRLVLETGMNQTPALRFYQRNGWTRCADFGDFIGAGEDVGGLSRCFEKWLI